MDFSILNPLWPAVQKRHSSTSSSGYGSGSGGSRFPSKFAAIYGKLFQGIPASQIPPHMDAERTLADVLDLKVDRAFLAGELNKLSKETCLGMMKASIVCPSIASKYLCTLPFLSTLFQTCMRHARTANYTDVKKAHALETLSVLIGCVLAKNLSGWEVMEILAGSVARSDAVFSEFTDTLYAIMADANAPALLRHQVLHVSLTYMCGVGQLSTGAYFLRRDFFPAIAALVKTPEMEEYTFEAILLLAILANYHKSDAAKLNPYLKRIKDCEDAEFMRKLCWASNFALSSSVKAYQDVMDDSIAPSVMSSIGSMLTRLRPDRALSFSMPTASREMFQDLPIEATVVLLPIYEFLLPSLVFPTVLMEDLVSPSETPETSQLSPLPSTIISLASYLCTHASSTGSSRSIPYARLALNTLLVMVENNLIMSFAAQTDVPVVRLCRQRPPFLPAPASKTRPLVCSILDTCILWLRNNMQKQLEVTCYVTVIWTCHRIVWFLQENRIRLEYDWKDLWLSTLGLLSFLSSRLDELHTTGGIEVLISETVHFLELAISTSEVYLPSPRAVHELIYELVRASSALKKQGDLLKSLALPRQGAHEEDTQSALTYIVTVTDYYADKVALSGTGISGNAKDVMKIIAAQIEADGLNTGGRSEGRETSVPSRRAQEVLDFGRVACLDGAALLP